MPVSDVVRFVCILKLNQCSEIEISVRINVFIRGIVFNKPIKPTLLLGFHDRLDGSGITRRSRDDIIENNTSIYEIQPLKSHAEWLIKSCISNQPTNHEGKNLKSTKS